MWRMQHMRDFFMVIVLVLVVWGIFNFVLEIPFQKSPEHVYDHGHKHLRDNTNATAHHNSVVFIKGNNNGGNKLNKTISNNLNNIAKNEEKNVTISVDIRDEEFMERFRVLNLMGFAWSNLDDLRTLASAQAEYVTLLAFFQRMSKKYDEIMQATNSLPEDHWSKKTKRHATQESTEITVAIVICGAYAQRLRQAVVMLKSIILFSQDASLHLVVFGDKVSLLQTGENILGLKWTANALGWDFTYELHLEWFPPGHADEWKKMYTTCATQRLFFPSLLPHIDSLIYMDTDTIMMSNLTDFWMEFSKNLNQTKMAAMTANNENARGWYNIVAKIPYYGDRGLNAGVMLMNLTQMRAFNFDAKAISTHTLYKEKIQLADQDILNIMFHAFPEKLYRLPCSYNFNWVHCGNEKYKCRSGKGKNVCFCNSNNDMGVKVVHGNSGTFLGSYYQFLIHLYSGMDTFDFFADSPADLIQGLLDDFKKLPEPCFPLTAEMMYGNARDYFHKIGIS